MTSCKHLLIARVPRHEVCLDIQVEFVACNRVLTDIEKVDEVVTGGRSDEFFLTVLPSNGADLVNHALFFRCLLRLLKVPYVDTIIANRSYNIGYPRMALDHLNLLLHSIHAIVSKLRNLGLLQLLARCFEQVNFVEVDLAHCAKHDIFIVAGDMDRFYRLTVDVRLDYSVV